MVIIFNCHWCNKKFNKKKKSNLLTRFCSRNCADAHYRARNAERLRKVQTEYRRNNLEKVRASKRKWNDKNKDYRHLWYLANSNIVKTTQLIGYRREMRSRQEAKRIVKKFGWERKCVQCGKVLGIQLHHVDGNPLNNDIKNLVYLCKKHHGEVHILMNKLSTAN